jgi:stage II sporulation protein GA (sporulation sigma-E factor processing peptidase)
MDVYLDLVMVLNFLVDFLLLLGTNRLAGFPSAPWRCACGAFMGAVYSGACLLPGFRFLGNVLWRGVSLCLMSVLAFGYNGSAWKRGGIFLLLSMSMGGIALSLGRGDVLSLVLCALICLLLSVVGFGGQVGGREYVPLKITDGGSSVSLVALKDTGNTLHDPLTGEQVLVAGAEVGMKLLGLSQDQIAHPVETMASGVLPGLRLIPYHAVGQAGSMLPAIRFSEARIGNRPAQPLVAFAPDRIARGEMYQMLTGGSI